MSSYQENRIITRAERETVLFYGVLVLLIGGGVGVYFPFFQDRAINAESLATYTLAALAPLWTDILLPEEYWRMLSIRGRMRIGLVCGLAALFSFVALVRNGKSYDMFCAIVGVIFVLCLFYHVWIISGRFAPRNPPSTEDGGPNPSTDKLGGRGLT